MDDTRITVLHSSINGSNIYIKPRMQQLLAHKVGIQMAPSPILTTDTNIKKNQIQF
jgi:hypothetical protein